MLAFASGRVRRTAPERRRRTVGRGMKIRRCMEVLSGVAVLLTGSGVRSAAQSCPQLSGVFATVQTGTTSGSSAESGSCGGGSAPEATFFFYAQRAGTYTIDTIGSAFDTVLYVRNDQGGELACNDDIAPGVIVQSRVTVSLAQSQLAVIFVDGSAAQSGTFTLR